MSLTLEMYADPNYEYQATLDNNLYTFKFKWNVAESAWYLSIVGITDSTIEINSLKLVGGVDLLEPYGIFGLGELWCVDLSEQNRDPEFENIATDFVLLYR